MNKIIVRIKKAVGGKNMKKIILGMMLLMGSLSFSEQGDRGTNNHDFHGLKSKTEVSNNVDKDASNDSVYFRVRTGKNS